MLLLLLLAALSASAEPLLKRFADCLGQHTPSLAPAEQRISFSQLWTQLDSSTLRISLLGQVDSQSSGYSPQTNFLATLISETAVLNFQAFTNQSALCSAIRTPPTTNKTASDSGCPYGPGQLALGVQLPLSPHPDYPFRTLNTQLQLLDTSTPALTLACIQLDTSPYHPHSIYFSLLRWIPLAILLGYLLVCALARLWAAIISEQLNREAQAAAQLDHHHHHHHHHHHRNPTTPSASLLLPRISAVWWLVWSGQGLLRSGALLRFSTPGTRDIISHLQFIALLGLFNVQWPEFVYPILTQSAWTTLIFNSTIVRSRLSSDPPPDPLSTPSYDPPQAFVSQFDTPSSPLYLNRSLPNVLLNYGDQQQGIPRWATTIGILPRDLFGVAMSLFAICAAAVALFSAISYLIALIATLVSSARLKHIHHHHHHQRDSGIFTSADTDDGRTCSPPTTTRVFHPHPHHHHRHQDKTTSSSQQPEKASLFDSLSHAPPVSSTQSVVWPQTGLHFALLQGNLLRLFILFYRPLVVFASFHLTLLHTASPISIAIAAILLILAVLIPLVQLWRLNRRSAEDRLDHPATILTLGPLYNTFDDRNVLFMGVRFASSFVVAVAIGAAQSHGIIQAVVLLIAELTETMLTSLWLPWGDGAAMAPLTFITSVTRIISAVILVVMTPTVSVGVIASGWLTYVVLLILGGVLCILVLVLGVKLVELVLRLGAHIPFDETRSTRAGGIRGAWRRWDRSSGSRSTRHGRAAAIAARRHRRRPPKPAAVGSRRTPRASIFSALNGQDNHPGELAHVQTPSLSPGFGAINDEDGNIMSAMSQGAWLRTAPPDNSLFPARPGMAPPDHSGPGGQPSSGFAVVRGGRATEKTPYLMHNDGRNSWRTPSHRPHDYPPSHHAHHLQQHHLPPSSSPPSAFFHSTSSSANPLNPHLAHSTTTTNLFDQQPAPFPLSGHSTSDDSLPHSSVRRRQNRKKKKKNTHTGGGLFGLFRSSARAPDRTDSDSTDSTDSSSSSDSSEEEEEEGAEDGASGSEDVSGGSTRRQAAEAAADGDSRRPGPLAPQAFRLRLRPTAARNHRRRRRSRTRAVRRARVPGRPAAATPALAQRICQYLCYC
ncbi:hypothetical protein PTTG_26827 [Puccinia triticina 1-1 BBBD Race 1]|uniref:TRP domain-containing protein n=1 Tax=Puccinia triticina (isolate 1-1 / race 1 (BBBD)) TaxID=630390 RepID=A0A180GRA9_PUCT1|nr:hypothetical protein PTTG_26827 [Puccinia triticina 1-1 BBBD Race 1]